MNSICLNQQQICDISLPCTSTNINSLQSSLVIPNRWVSPALWWEPATAHDCSYRYRLKKRHGDAPAAPQKGVTWIFLVIKQIVELGQICKHQGRFFNTQYSFWRCRFLLLLVVLQGMVNSTCIEKSFTVTSPTTPPNSRSSSNKRMQ